MIWGMKNPEMIINPIKDKGDPELPPTGLLLVNPMEANTGMRIAEARNGEKHFLFNSNLAVINVPGPVFIAGPSVGAPMAVLTLEKLIALGAKRVIVYGWCGSLNNSMKIGDVLLPSWAVSAEGTSAHYPLTCRPESHLHTRQVLYENLTEHGLKVLSGPVWTTDAPYRESIEQVHKLGEQGVLGVDMEYAALAAAAAYRNIELTAVMLVSDELNSRTWDPGFNTKEFKKTSKIILDLLVEFCQKTDDL
jgi:uridine phosphorylase